MIRVLLVFAGCGILVGCSWFQEEIIREVECTTKCVKCEEVEMRCDFHREDKHDSKEVQRGKL